MLRNVKCWVLSINGASIPLPPWLTKDHGAGSPKTLKAEWKIVLVLHCLSHCEFTTVWFLHCTWIRLHSVLDKRQFQGDLWHSGKAIGFLWILVKRIHWHQWYSARSIHHNSRDGLDWSSEGVKKRSADRHMDRELGMVVVGSCVKKSQHLRSSGHLLYRLEQKCRVTACPRTKMEL